MALSKRNSRPIVVDGQHFRYCVSLGPSDSSSNFPLNVTVQSENGVGAKLCIMGLNTRDFWVDMPNVAPEEYWKTAYKTVLPKHVALWIIKAIAEGWIPTTTGPPFLIQTEGVLPDTDK